ncbi:MAG: peptide-methionine (S)-S-oxide reductase MsrA [Coriobacteriia bacterium]|nr:peptide-methionine (S)-S-oxide reductase MsrA [Coriobacteriia bacterium]
MSGYNEEDRFAETEQTRPRPPLDDIVPWTLETATFAMGCFWLPDARFGLTKGVWRTRVGYAGGTKLDPTYHDLGDHTECVQVQFDPTVVSYNELLGVMWASHNPTSPAYTRQYESIVLANDEEQLELAHKSAAALEALYGKRLYTRIELLKRFWPAEDYHQKYHLQNDEEMMADFWSMFPTLQDFVDSPTAARVNGYLTGEGTPERLIGEIGLFGLSEEGQLRLGDIVMRR